MEGGREGRGEEGRNGGREGKEEQGRNRGREEGEVEVHVYALNTYIVYLYCMYCRRNPLLPDCQYADIQLCCVYFMVYVIIFIYISRA